MTQMFVTKRDGRKVKFDKEKIINRISILLFNIETKHIDINLIVDKVYNGIYNNITTCELDNLAAETCAYMNLIHPSYSILAARIAVSNLHKETNNSFFETIKNLYSFVEKGKSCNLIDEEVFNIIKKNRIRIEKEIDIQKDFEYDYFGFKTLEKSYLLKINNKIVERPQYMLMRVSIGIHKNDLDNALKTYKLMSEKWFTHATPTLFNAGTPQPQMSSCFLLTMQDDSIDGIYNTLKQCALISKSAGGIGLSVSTIRSQGSYINGTNGRSNGIVPMLRVFDATARYVDQGGGKRKGSFAIYLEPWHADIYEFLELKKNHGKEEQKARDLFYAIWMNDLFMKRVELDQDWTLMCPNQCQGLVDSWGEKFEELYLKFERNDQGVKTVKARELFFSILQAQIETGVPYIVYKDACNRKSNQQNLGTIKSSNLCTEIVEYTSKDEIAVCNLASIALSKFVNPENRTFDFKKLIEVTKQATFNLNKVIDENYYPVKEAKNSNMKHRPIGIGVQGFADCLALMRYPFESQEAFDLNEKIFETIYFASVTESNRIAVKDGHYSSFKGSPASKGNLQFDLWNYKPKYYDWTDLKNKVVEHGLRNSLLVAPMPTASTSQILGNNETFEPFTSNIYNRRVLSGEFICINKYLVKDLIKLDIWDSDMRNNLLHSNGSIQNIEGIPQDIKDLYKTVWEISQKKIIDLAASRGPFIDQSQSLNIHIPDPNYQKLTAMHFHGWKSGLKTGMYYLRTRPAVDAIKFTVNVEKLLKSAGNVKLKDSQKISTIKEEDYEDELCLNCGS